MFLLIYSRWRHFTKEMKHIHLSELRRVIVSVWRIFREEADHLQQSAVKHRTERVKNLRRHQLSPLGKRQKSELNKRATVCEAPPAEWSSQVWGRKNCCPIRKVLLPGVTLAASPGFLFTMKLTHDWDHVTTVFVPFGHNNKISQLEEQDFCWDVKSSAFPPELFIHV